VENDGKWIFKQLESVWFCSNGMAFSITAAVRMMISRIAAGWARKNDTTIIVRTQMEPKHNRKQFAMNKLRDWLSVAVLVVDIFGAEAEKNNAAGQIPINVCNIVSRKQEIIERY
jgi:hypothetical protein